MKRLLIVGAGGFGREMWNYLQDHPDCGRAWTVQGFLDDGADALEGYDYPVGIVGTIRDYAPQPDDLLVNGLGLPQAKQACLGPLRERGGCFLTFVHPSARIGRNVRLGIGTVVCPEVILTADITVGDFVVFNVRCSAGHDSRVGTWSTLSCYSEVTGYAQVGEGVFMGSHAAVLPRMQVGDDATLGAGAIVVGHVRPGQTVFGVPARPIR